MTAGVQLPLTEWLSAWRAGDGQAFEAVIQACYAELRGMAGERLARQGPLTLTAHDLLHEALARVMTGPTDFRNRAHFLATLSLLMRSILVDHARARSAEKRGGGLARVTLTEANAGAGDSLIDVLALDAALLRLARQDPRGAEVLHLRYFGGMRQEDIAELMGVSAKTIERGLRFARAWLFEALGEP